MIARVLVAIAALACAGCTSTSRGTASASVPRSEAHSEAEPAPREQAPAVPAIDNASARNTSAAAELELSSARTALAEDRVDAASDHLARASAAASELATQKLAAPQLAAIDLVRGRMHELARHWSDARDAYAGASRKDPSSVTAILLEARVLSIAGDTNSAAERLACAAQDHASSVELQRAAGETLLAAHDAERALPFLRRALALAHSDAGAFESLARALFRLGRHAEIAALAEEIRAESLSDGARLLVARSALIAGRADLAARMLEANTSVLDADAEAWLDLARARALSDRISDAREAVEHALALAPDSVDALLLAGHIQKLDGHPRDAAVSYSRALRVGADPATVAALIDALAPVTKRP
jgi:tetratricopeptide (TPR) repeat protein